MGIYLRAVDWSVTCHMGSHSVTCHPTQVNAPRLNPSHAGRYSIYLPRRDGRLSLPWCWLYTEMVYLSADDPGSNQLIATRPGVELTTFWSLVHRPNRYATEPLSICVCRFTMHFCVFTRWLWARRWTKRTRRRAWECISPPVQFFFTK